MIKTTQFKVKSGDKIKLVDIDKKRFYLRICVSRHSVKLGGADVTKENGFQTYWDDSPYEFYDNAAQEEFWALCEGNAIICVMEGVS